MCRWIIAALVAVSLMQSAARADDAARIVKQLSGQEPAPQRAPDALAKAYDEALASLLPGAAAEKIEDRAAPQQAIDAMCVFASRPGADAERATLCKALLARIGDDQKRPVRIWLLRQLERIGGSESVEPLAKLLGDRDGEIADLARRALIANGDPAAACKALRDHLLVTSDDARRAALLDALAARRDPDACELAQQFVGNGDVGVRMAAISAVGETCGAGAFSALLDVIKSEDAANSGAAIDAALRLADRLVRDGKRDAAVPIFTYFHTEGKTNQQILAGLRGRLAAQPDDEELIQSAVEMLRGSNSAEFRLQVARLLIETPGAAVAKQLSFAATSGSATSRALAITALGERNDPDRRKSIVAALDAEDVEVRVAAIRALRGCAAESDIVKLATFAGDGADDERRAAREVLRTAPDLRDLIVANLPNVKSAARAALLTALGERRESDALPTLIKFADDYDRVVVSAALGAIGELGGEKEITPLVGILIRLRPPARDDAEDALARVILRVPDKDRRVEPLLAQMHSGEVADQPSLLRVLARAGGQQAFEALRLAWQEKDSQIADAAIRGLANWPDLEALIPLLEIYGDAPTPTLRAIALRGIVRLMKLPSERQPAESVRIIERLILTTDGIPERKMILSALAEVPHLKAIALAKACLPDPELKDAAGLALVGIARRFAAENREAAVAALADVQAGEFSEPVKEAARQATDFLDQFNGYIGMWVWCGPFRTEGKKPAEIADTGYPPEVPGAAGVEWKPLAARSADNPWIFDLTRIDREPARCMYVRAQIWSDAAQAARLELGSDDGVKAWLNGDLVHKFWGGRPVTPGGDKVAVDLKAGWNLLMLKITQDSGGWGFTCAVHGPNGESLNGLKFKAE